MVIALGEKFSRIRVEYCRPGAAEAQDAGEKDESRKCGQENPPNEDAATSDYLFSTWIATQWTSEPETFTQRREVSQREFCESRRVCVTMESVKTSIVIPDVTLRRAKARAAECGIPLRQFVAEVVEDRLTTLPSSEKPWTKMAGKLKHLHRGNGPYPRTDRRGVQSERTRAAGVILRPHVLPALANLVQACWQVSSPHWLVKRRIKMGQTMIEASTLWLRVAAVLYAVGLLHSLLMAVRQGRAHLGWR